MNFDDSRPIYLQLLEDFKEKISSGKRARGEKIASVRSLAQEYEVNPNTVQRALQELEREGLAESRRTVGRYVTEDESLIKSVSKDAFILACDDFIGKCQGLKLEKDQALERLGKYREEKDGN